MAPKLSAITTCKGRLDDLKQSIPRLVTNPDVEVIVVDYDCPDGTADFIRQNYPAVKVAKVNDQPGFNVSAARNIGAGQATGEFLFMTDADMVYKPAFMQQLPQLLKPGTLALFGQGAVNSARGTCIVPREYFDKVGGYDEMLAGYESEDLDIYMRLDKAGISRVAMPTQGIERVIEQTRDQQLRYRKEDLKKQFLRGQLYIGAKEMLMSVEDIHDIPLPFRKRMMQRINNQIDQLYDGSSEFELDIDLPDKYQRGFLSDWEFSRKVTIKARKK